MRLGNRPRRRCVRSLFVARKSVGILDSRALQGTKPCGSAHFAIVTWSMQRRTCLTCSPILSPYSCVRSSLISKSSPDLVVKLARFKSLASHFHRAPRIIRPRTYESSEVWHNPILLTGRNRFQRRAMSSPPNKQAGYLSGLASYSPWSGSRSSTPKPGEKVANEPTPELQRGGDHAISRRHRLSLRQYPRDCPPLNVKWFHAVDIPKRKPQQTQASDAPAAAAPKKYVPFSDRDSRAVEQAYQKLDEHPDARVGRPMLRRDNGAPPLLLLIEESYADMFQL